MKCTIKDPIKNNVKSIQQHFKQKYIYMRYHKGQKTFAKLNSTTVLSILVLPNVIFRILTKHQLSSAKA